MPTCPNCGNQAAENAVFCDQCGARLPAPAPEAVVEPVAGGVPEGVLICPDCGAENVPGELFCDVCGNPLEAPVLVAEADDLVASPPAQIDVDIGTIGPAGIHETLEIEPVLDGTDPRKTQHVGHQGTGGGASHLDRNVPPLGEVDDLVHHEEVIGEAVLSDGRQFVLQPLDDVMAGRTVPFGQAKMAEPGQFPVAGCPSIKLDFWKDRFATQQLEIAPLHEPIRVRECPGSLPEFFADLPGGYKGVGTIRIVEA